MKQSKKIAITGGIGSGKSAVAEIIATAGFAVFSCDKIYAQLTADPNSPLLKEIGKEFKNVFNEYGLLDKKKLSSIVFSAPELRKKLNQITHPYIMAEAFKKMEEHSLSFLEVPLLFEEGLQNKFNGVIVVLRPLNDRIISVVKRSGLTYEEVKTRINNQFDYQNCNFAKYYVIHNDSNFDDLRAKTLDILNTIAKS